MNKATPPARRCSAESVRIVIASIACLSAASALAQDRPSRFWNLTRHTVAKFHLAPAGTTDWGKNQCENDKDGTVDVDERLRITDIKPGHYDARIVDVSGRECRAENIEIKTGEVFSLEEKDLKSCTP
jgi:hypothetical protein